MLHCFIARCLLRSRPASLFHCQSWPVRSRPYEWTKRSRKPKSNYFTGKESCHYQKSYVRVLAFPLAVLASSYCAYRVCHNLHDSRWKLLTRSWLYVVCYQNKSFGSNYYVVFNPGTWQLYRCSNKRAPIRF